MPNGTIKMKKRPVNPLREYNFTIDNNIEPIWKFPEDRYCGDTDLIGARLTWLKRNFQGIPFG
jgi:hypothetical protein